jgi:hypothetical protein
MSRCFVDAAQRDSTLLLLLFCAVYEPAPLSPTARGETMRTTTKKSSVTGKGRISGVFPLRVICALSGVHFHVFASLPSQNTHTHTHTTKNKRRQQRLPLSLKLPDRCENRLNVRLLYTVCPPPFSSRKVRSREVVSKALPTPYSVAVIAIIIIITQTCRGKRKEEDNARQTDRTAGAGVELRHSV